MSWERTWSFKKPRLKPEHIREAAEAVARDYTGVVATVEKDGEDILCLFSVPFVPEGAPEGTEPRRLEVEVSIYDMGADGHVISLEADAADNNEAWDDASQLAEELAERLHAEELDL